MSKLGKDEMASLRKALEIAEEHGIQDLRQDGAEGLITAVSMQQAVTFMATVTTRGCCAQVAQLDSVALEAACEKLGGVTSVATLKQALEEQGDG